MSSSDPRTPKVLIVDDSPTIVLQLKKILAQMQISYETRADGEQGFAAISKEKSFDLVILDQHMPKMTGLELCQKIRSELKLSLVPILFITGSTDRNEISSLFRAGANDYIAKPFSPEEIIARITTHIATFHLHRANEAMYSELRIAHDRLMASAQILEVRVAERTDELRAINQKLEAEIEIRKEKEVALQQSVEVAEAALRVKSEFLANMSHEIRTPLNSILGISDIILETMTDEEHRGLLTTVRDSGSTLLTIVNDILDFSKIESGKLQLSPVTFSIRTLISRIETIIAPRIQEKEQSFVVAISDQVSELVLGDEIRIGQILLNLLANSIKFTPQQGGILLTVFRNEHHTNDATVVFAVSDSGVGISPHKLDSIFEAFQQEDASTSREYGGTGLGLTISRRLASLMNGKLTVKSTRGIGSTFVLELPLEPRQSDTNFSAHSSDAPPTASAQLPPRRILLAEDNPVNQTLAIKILSKQGHHVTLATTGLEVLSILDRHGEQIPFDVILMDCQMPHLSGYDATQMIRQHKNATVRALPIVALTAHALHGDREKCLESGMDDYLTKPLNKKLLLEVIEKWSSQTR